MIAELFYPKELKEIIADLRAKGDLDEGALKRMNKHVRKRFITGVIFCLIFSFLSIALDDFFAILFINVMVVYGIYSVIKDIYTDVKIYPIFYSVGDTTEGIVSRKFETGVITVNPVCAWGLDYNYFVNLKKYSQKARNIKHYFSRDKYQIGQKIPVFYNPKNPEQSIPYISSLYPLFNLKKRKLSHDLTKILL